MSAINKLGAEMAKENSEIRKRNGGRMKAA
jgi:hypothetical protein